MKRFLLLLLVLPCFLACHQVKEFENDTYIPFTLKDTLADPVNWQQENMFAEFTLRGKEKITYALHPINDSITFLSRWVDGSWQLQDSIHSFGWLYTRILKHTIKSYFKITDFDKDGDQDLTCWVDTDVHTNKWTIIFINDERQQKLVKLVDITNNGIIWDDPRYDSITGIISTELRSGAYGEQNTAAYKLQGTTIEPLFMESVDLRNPEKITHETYKGENGKWKLQKIK